MYKYRLSTLLVYWIHLHVHVTICIMPQITKQNELASEAKLEASTARRALADRDSTITDMEHKLANLQKASEERESNIKRKVEELQREKEKLIEELQEAKDEGSQCLELQRENEKLMEQLDQVRAGEAKRTVNVHDVGVKLLV